MESAPPLPDTDAIALAMKAAIDGLVLARVIPDDDGSHVLYIGIHAPTQSDRNSLTITLESA